MNQRLVLQIEWGVWNAYYQASDLHAYDFSGEIRVERGRILSLCKVEHRIHDACQMDKVFLPLEGTAFTSYTHNGMEGLQAELDGDDATVVTLDTAQETLTFTIDELRRQGHIVRYVGPKYGMAVIHVQLEGLE